MFLSKDDLKLSYGVDMEIGRTYVDRKVPQSNHYWLKRHLYMVPMPGYVFMPIFTDLAYRLGISKQALLSETYLSLAERIMDSAGKLEGGLINWTEHIAECDAIASAVSCNPAFLEELRTYFAGGKSPSGLRIGSPFKSLRRGDTYLFTLVGLAFEKSLHQPLVDAWNSLITYFLIKDDLEDIRKDFTQQEENAVIEAGLSEEGAKIITSMIDDSYEKMSRVNPVMANRIDHKRSITDVKSIIESFLKEQSPA